MVLSLTLKKEWFDLIQQGVKTEEYREIKPYWDVRLKKYIDYGKPFEIIFKNGYSRDARVIKMRCEGIKIETLSLSNWTESDNRKFYVLGPLTPLKKNKE